MGTKKRSALNGELKGGPLKMPGGKDYIFAHGQRVGLCKSEQLRFLFAQIPEQPHRGRQAERQHCRAQPGD